MESEVKRTVITGLDKVTEDIGKLSLNHVHFWAPVPKNRRDVYHWLANFEFNGNIPSAKALSLNVAIADGPPSQATDTDGYKFATLKVDVRPQNVLSTNVAIDFGVRLLRPVTAKDVIELVTKNKMEYYKFAPEGSGCLWWQTVLLDKMVKEKWVAAKSLQNLEKKIKDHIADKKCANRLLYPPIEGKFYGVVEEGSADQGDTPSIAVIEQPRDATRGPRDSPLVNTRFDPTPGQSDEQASNTISLQFEQLNVSPLAAAQQPRDITYVPRRSPLANMSFGPTHGQPDEPLSSTISPKISPLAAIQQNRDLAHTLRPPAPMGVPFSLRHARPRSDQPGPNIPSQNEQSELSHID